MGRNDEMEEKRLWWDERDYIMMEDSTGVEIQLGCQFATIVHPLNMKSSYLLASLALGSTTLARLIPRAELDSRQWGTCRWTGHCLGMS